MNILTEIVNYKKEFVSNKKLETPISKLKRSAYFQRPTFSLSKAIKENENGIIGEFKRKSPSVKNINLNGDPLSTAKRYLKQDVAAFSVLTDEKYFGGKNEDLSSIREVSKPILRKDFILSEYQIIEAKSIGADAILLIGEILSERQTFELAKFANSLELEVLFELHSSSELYKINEFIQVVGVNNRNLKTFKTDIEASVSLYNRLPKRKTIISESGIKNYKQIEQLKSIGFDGFLIGESLMKEQLKKEVIC